MTKGEQTNFVLLPEWRLIQDGSTLRISGGSDAQFEVVLGSDEPSFFASLKPSRPFTRSAVSDFEQAVLEELLTAQIVVPSLQKLNKQKIASVGDPHNLTLSTQVDSKRAAFLVIVRTTSTYAQLLENIAYQDIWQPHIFIDLAFHHTVSIGPLVFPGETACIACLQGRISTRWGDEQPPEGPRASRLHATIASALLELELDKVAHDDTSLTNKTVSWNFQDRTTRQDQLLKVPFCPICSRGKTSSDGKLMLPWV